MRRGGVWTHVHAMYIEMAVSIFMKIVLAITIERNMRIYTTARGVHADKGGLSQTTREARRQKLIAGSLNFADNHWARRHEQNKGLQMHRARHCRVHWPCQDPAGTLSFFNTRGIAVPPTTCARRHKREAVCKEMLCTLANPRHHYTTHAAKRCARRYKTSCKSPDPLCTL